MTQSLRTLLTDIVDYAGLFPPAKLDMPGAANAYARCRAGPHEWMLGKFICPVMGLADLERTGALPASGEPWAISALMDGDLEAGIEAVGRFNERHADPAAGLAEITAVELKVSAPAQIDAALDALPEELLPFFEFTIGMPGTPGDSRGFVAALAGERAAAKIRTGGVAQSAFPATAEIVGFLRACKAAEVPFKATAGLHHPVRGHFPLTYEAGAPKGHMYGFLNIFMAAALVYCHSPNDDDVAALLREEDPASFTFSDSVATWRGHGWELGQLANVREHFALSFGSCSFDEPVEDLRRLGLMA